MNIGTQEALDHVDDSALIQAVEHHRRAVEALGGLNFSTATMNCEDLVQRMKEDLSRLEEEMQRRGLFP